MLTSNLQDAMAAAGLQPHKPLDLAADGKIHRYRVMSDKAGSTNGWYSLNDGPEPFGVFGSWKTGVQHTWRGVPTKPPTAAERAATAQRLQAAKQAHAEAQQLVHAEASTRAQKLWSTAHPASGDHPYLVRKRIPAIGIRRLRDMLVIPARDVHGQLHTLQFIGADGGKRFLTGGRISGCYFAMGRPVDRLLLAEGLATGATLYQATGAAVAVCFSCGNLLAVARALREKFPRLRLVVCADNDLATPNNPGVTKAREAARAVGGFLAVPQLRQAVTA